MAAAFVKLFMVPVPVFDSFAALNAHLTDCCRKRMGEVLRGHTETIGERLARDLAAFQSPLPRPTTPARRWACACRRCHWCGTG
jgi:hypothetical protein